MAQHSQRPRRNMASYFRYFSARLCFSKFFQPRRRPQRYKSSFFHHVCTESLLVFVSLPGDFVLSSCRLLGFFFFFRPSASAPRSPPSPPSPILVFGLRLLTNFSRPHLFCWLQAGFAVLCACFRTACFAGATFVHV